ncbi:YozQ family protein [Bacillus massilinigeriensis]|uniref:YozQ family protein n=1 Tax=Bacillus mediterraneensis TaxID=1805474 RepID=UPI0008F8F11B|nr:YozQ family protein [Bacillus mediterraneensis]
MAKDIQGQENLKMAGQCYNGEAGDEKGTFSKGLKVTHEQVSDAYTEGEIRPVIDDANGHDIPVKRKDYK